MTRKAELTAAIEKFFGARPPARLGVAVSGGSDSLALLHLLHDWMGADLFAVTVDHGLRAASASEALHVATVCEALGVPHDILEWKGWDGKGNLQAEARRTRYALMGDWARKREIGLIALGHTRDDQAETVLMRLAREAGLDGLSGMPAAFDSHGTAFCRPLLDVSRAALRAYLDDRRVRWVDDPSNEDEEFERVRARRVLSALEPLGIAAETLVTSAGYLREAREALSLVASDFARENAKVVAGDVIFDRARLNRLPVDLRRRLLAGGLRWVASTDYPPRRAPLAEAEAACHRPRNLTLHGCRLLVSDMTVRIVREHAAVAAAHAPTDALWDNRWTLTGPHAPDLEIRALGDAIARCPAWRDTGLPRASLLASPAIWRAEDLVAAPVAGLEAGWTATTRGTLDFARALIAH